MIARTGEPVAPLSFNVKTINLKCTPEIFSPIPEPILCLVKPSILMISIKG